jgi:hypothetical protein|tara:strand:- start:3431 stop:3643 length:213 start_codon:yes stop_codon:yes gene_type:complete
MRYKNKVLKDAESAIVVVESLRHTVNSGGLSREEALTVLDNLEDKLQYIVDAVELEVDESHAELGVDTLT